MTGYRIGKTVIKNFLAFASATFDFSRPGLTTVEGEIENVVGCDSNGAGKSALLEAPVWAITGRTIRERCSGDDVILLGSKGGCVVDTTVVGEKTIRIVRHRGHTQHANKVFLYVDGKDVSRGTSRATDAAIESELGLDFTTFMNTVAFGARAEVRSFFFSSDADRKAVMDKLLGLEAFGHAQVLARARMRAKAESLHPLMDRQMKLGFAIQEGQESVAALAKQPRVDKIELNDQRIAVKRLTARVESLQVECAKSKADLQTATAALSESRKAHDVAMSQFHKAQSDHVRETSTLDERARAAIAAASGLESRAAKLRGLAGGSCPTCRQGVSQGSAELAARELTDEAAAMREDASSKSAKSAAIKKAAALVNRPAPPDDHEVLTHSSDYDLRREALNEAKSLLTAANAKLQAMEDQDKQSRGRLDEVRSKVADLQAELSNNLDAQKVVKDEITRIEFWVQAFGNGGVKSFVIESEIPRINAIATNYARRLLGQGAFVRVAATKKLKTSDQEREELTVEAGIPGCAQSYAGASKGQRHRLDLSLILAFRTVVAARSACPFDQLFADELFDGVDATGVDCVVEILHEISKTCPVLLVTHDARLKSVGDRRVVVVHDGTSATLR